MASGLASSLRSTAYFSVTNSFSAIQTACGANTATATTAARYGPTVRRHRRATGFHTR